MMCITVTVLSINDCFYPSVTRQPLTNKSDPTSGAFISKNDPKGGSPVTKNDTAKIAWIMLGVSVALSALVVGIIVCRKRAKRNDKRYFIQMLISLKFRILFFVAELFHDKNIHAEMGMSIWCRTHSQATSDLSSRPRQCNF